MSSKLADGPSGDGLSRAKEARHDDREAAQKAATQRVRSAQLFVVGWLEGVVLEGMLAGVSTRWYRRAQEPVGPEVETDARSTSKSAVSRTFVHRAAVLFTRRCERAGIEVSMGSVGDCYENAVCETFHASLKKERIYRRSWPTRAEARTGVFEYIKGWYNPRRRHSTFGYLSPADSNATTQRSTPVASQPSASPSPATAPSFPRSPSMLQPIALRPRRTVVKGRTELPGLSAR